MVEIKNAAFLRHFQISLTIPGLAAVFFQKTRFAMY